MSTSTPDEQRRNAEVSPDSLDGFLRAYLQGAELRGAFLGGADLFNADLAGADLRETNLIGADFSGVRYDGRTVWPEGFDPQAAGAVRVADPF